jgi:Kef-type K+ transport system membrane component KefB
MTGNTTVDFFLALALLLGAARLLGEAARLIGQPPVVGEILAGVLASPMVLTGAGSEALLSPSVKPLIGALANVGLAIFMFVIGYEIDVSFLRGRKRAALGVAAGSVLLPLAGGVALAVPLAGTYAPADHASFVLFVGVAMSVTAFPVLARILADHGISRLFVGVVSLTAAAIGDVVAWICLAGVVAYAGASGQWHVILLPVYLLLMFTVVRPALAAAVRAADRRGRPMSALFPLLVAVLMLSCAGTEWLGIHFIFGAFACGAGMPRGAGSTIRIQIIEQMEQTGGIMLPLYFVVAGTKVDLSVVGAGTIGTLAAVIAVAVATKAVGAYSGARLAGVPHETALPVAMLMNTRGLTEIVIVVTGLDMHLIDQDFYSIMVIMAIATTAMTGPLLRVIGVGERAPKPVAVPEPGRVH